MSPLKEINHNLVKKILDEAYELRVHDLSQSIALTEKALSLSREFDLPSLTASGLSRLALYRMIRGENDVSLKMSREAIEIFTSLDDERGIAIAKYSVAGLYYKSNNFHLGMVYLLDCLISFRKFKDYHNESRTLKSLGTVYEFLKDFQNAKISYEGAVIAAKNAKDFNLESNAYNPMSGLLLKLNDTVKAMELIEQSIKLKTKTNDQRGLAFAIYGRGKVHLSNKDYTKAERDFFDSIERHEKFGEKLGKSMTRHKLARLWVLQGKRAESIHLLKDIIKTTDENNSLFVYLKATRFLSQLYFEDGNTTASLSYLQRYIQKKELAQSEQTIQVVENYERAAVIKSSEREVRLELEKSEILATKDRAEQAAMVKQDFLSVMSHEIRTPLNAVTSIISLLENRSSKEEQELLTALRFSSKNLLRIIDDILDFSKLDSNKMQLDLHPVNFNTLLDNIKATYVPMAGEKGLRLEMDLSPRLANAYMLDETKLFQILGNLLSNAVNYTTTGFVSITIDVSEVSTKGHTLNFKVIDSGSGIPSKDLEQLFESFYIPKSITTRDIGGTGLGLAIVKRMVALHGSEVEVQSTVGEGSVFSFALECEFAEVIESKNEVFLEALEGKTALLAEDNEINALVMRKLLEKYGLTIYRAKDGEEALKLSHEHKVDFILMDIHMPKLNGFETSKIIKTQDNINSTTPIFALTADINAVHNEEYTKFFDGYLRKPMEIDRLLEAFLKVTDETFKLETG